MPLQIDPTAILPLGTEPTRQYSPTREELDTVSMITHRLDLAARARKNVDWEIERNRLMLKGNVLVARDTTTDTLVRIHLADGTRTNKTSRENILRTTARALVGKHTRIIPSVVVMPGSADEADVRGAAVATSFLEHIANKEKLRKKYVGATRLKVVDGTAVWQVFWDKRGGRELAWCSKPECGYVGDKAEVGEQCPICQQQGMMAAMQSQMEAVQQWQQEADQATDMGMEPPPEPSQEPDLPPPSILSMVHEGEIRIIYLEARNYFPEPNVEEQEDVRWAIVKLARPVNELREMFPAMADYIHEESGLDWGRGNPFDTDGNPVEDSEGYAEYIEYHERPSPGSPEGRLICIVNGHVVNGDKMTPDAPVGEPHPYASLPTLPFYPFRWERNPGSFWGESFIVQASGIQEERNTTLTQMRGEREACDGPPLLVPMGSQLSESDFYSMEPKKIIKYNPMAGGMPKYLERPPFPTYTYQELERMRTAIQSQATVTDQEMGLTQGDQSGRYAAFLESQAGETIRPIVVENNQALCDLARAILIIAQERHSADYVWVVRGREKVKSYDWSQVNLNPGWDVVLAESDSLSSNPALRLQQAQNLLSVGFFTDPTTGAPDMQRFARMAGIKEAAVGPDMDSSERAYAAAIPDMVAAGKFDMSSPRPWDDAKVCAEELMAWLRGPGRQAEPQLQQMVGQIWMGYANLAAPMIQSAADARSQPNALGQQQVQPQSLGTGPVPGGELPGDEMSQNIAQADNDAESLARPGEKHEG